MPVRPDHAITSTDSGGLDARVHDWSIAQREYDRMEARRGRRHAYTHLDPARTALVVIDVMPFFVDEPDLPHCRGVLPQIVALAEALRAAGGTTAWVVSPGTGTPPTPAAVVFFGQQVADLYAASGGAGSPRERLWPGFDVHPEDLVVEKTAASAFFPGRCDLPQLLEDRDIDTVVITGMVTNVCCESSARDAATLGYRVVFVADANAAADDAAHNATLTTVYRTFGDVRTTADVLEMVCG
ncbi:MAG: cysteine hydrolase [Quadrisphaera sp.]